MPRKAKLETEIKAATNSQGARLDLDGLLKFLFALSDVMIIRMINSLLHKRIPLDAKVIRVSVEPRRIMSDGKSISALRADMILLIDGELYHIEFQTKGDKTMIVRMFSYGFEIVMSEIEGRADYADNEITLNYPKQFVIYLEEDDSAPESELTMKVKLWDGYVSEYKVPIMRYWEKTADDLIANDLEPLLPLQVFKLRKSLDAIARSQKLEDEKKRLIAEKISELLVIFADVTEKIKTLTQQSDRLSEPDARRMMEALQYLAEFLYDKYEPFTKVKEDAAKMFKSMWGFEEIDKAREEAREKVREAREEAHKKAREAREARKEARNAEVKRAKETAYEMFLDGVDVAMIKKYVELPEEDLADVLRGLPEDIQSKYNLVGA